jgi:predicted nucleotidyltransferase
MKSDAFTIPKGQSLRKVRDFLREHEHHNSFSNADVARYFGADITNNLVAHGLIEAVARQGRFEASSLGSRLINLRLLPRIDRAKAERMLAALLERVREVNARTELLYRVKRVHVFGSFITDAPDLGDIDLALELERKQAEIEHAGGKWIAALLARAEASGKRFSTYSGMVGYAELEVRRLLKARSPYLEFHSFDGIERLQIESRCIFPDAS